MTPSLELLSDQLAQTLTALGVAVVPGTAASGHARLVADVVTHLTLDLGEQIAVVVLATDAATAVELARTISGAEVGSDDPLLGDTMGEILNVVAGAARRRAHFTFGIPSLARDKRQIMRLLERRYQSRRCLVGGGAVDLFFSLGEARTS